MSKKMIQLANFNIVFLKKQKAVVDMSSVDSGEKNSTQGEFNTDNELPLLEYFDTIFMPAITSDVKRTLKNRTKYFFQNIQVVQREDELLLTGKIVKDTVLVVQSVLNNESGELEPSNQKVRSSPYSVFVIFLRSHRMSYVRNQQGSPTLKNFESLVKFCLDTYIKKKNFKIINETKKDKKQELFPKANVNIEGLPADEQKIRDILDKVDRINTLTLKFYPLNGDVDLSPQLNGALKELRKQVVSTNGNLVLNSPKSKHGVAEFIAESEGTFHPVLQVTYPDKTKQKITETEITECHPFEFTSDNINENDLLMETTSMEKLKKVSAENEELYQRNKLKIIPFVKNQR